MATPNTNRTRRSIAFLSEKGGTGKTTTLINIAQAVRMLGNSCLIIDCDPQASVSAWFDLVANSKDASMKKFVQLLPDFKTIRSGDELRDLHEELDMLEEDNDGYDWVFYDLAGYIGENIEYGAQAEIILEVLKTADCLLTPIVPDPFTVIQAVKATPKINDALDRLGRKDEVACFTVFNRIRNNESISKQTISDVTEYAESGALWPLLTNKIENSPSIPFHLSKGRNCYIPHLHHKTASAYENVFKEIMLNIAPEKSRSVVSLSARSIKTKRELSRQAEQTAKDAGN